MLPRSALRVQLGAGAAAFGAIAWTLIGSVNAVRAAPVAPVLSATATPGELTLGAALTVTGTLVEAGTAVPSMLVALQADSYPFRGYATIARQTTAADNSHLICHSRCCVIGPRANRTARPCWRWSTVFRPA